MNDSINNTDLSASAHGSAAKTSMDNKQSKGSRRTPIPGNQEPIRNPDANINTPKITPIYNEDPRNFYQRFGSPMFVNPAMFANPFQQAEFMYPPNPYWAFPNMLGNQPISPQLSGGRIPSQSSATVNENLVGEQTTQPVATGTTLNRINDPSEFSTWVKNFIVFLNEHQLEHIIPNENGQPTNSATDKEKKFITDTFKFFVSPKAYPTWFSKKLKERFIELYDVIEHALYQENGYDSERAIAKELNSIYYDGKSDPFFFQKKLHNLRQKGLEVGITTTDAVLCDRIVEHLSGHFKSIANNYDRNYTTISLNDLLDEIQRVYNRHIKDKKESTSSITNDTNSTSVTIPRNATAIKSNSQAVNKGKGKGKGKRLFHIQDLDPEYNELRPYQV